MAEGRKPSVSYDFKTDSGTLRHFKPYTPDDDQAFQSVREFSKTVVERKVSMIKIMCCECGK